MLVMRRRSAAAFVTVYVVLWLLRFSGQSGSVWAASETKDPTRDASLTLALEHADASALKALLHPADEELLFGATPPFKRNGVSPGFSHTLSSPVARVEALEFSPSGSSKKSSPLHLAFLGLLVLVVPVTIGVFLAVCFYRRTRYKRKMKDLRLNGTRRPGEVDDVDMGQVVKGGDWLNLDNDNTGGFGAGVGRSRFSLLRQSNPDGGRAVRDTFDPIGQQAADAQQRKRARRVAVTAAEAAGSHAGGGDDHGDNVGDSAAALGSPHGDEPFAADAGIWSSDEEGGSNGGGGGGTGDGGLDNSSAPIYATSLAAASGDVRANGFSFNGGTDDAVVTGGLAASPSRKGGGSSRVNAADAFASPLTLSHNSQYFNVTAQLLSDQYATDNVVEGDGHRDGSASQRLAARPSNNATLAGISASLRPTLGVDSSGGRSFGNKPNAAFEQILSLVAAPLQIGQEFHQRGDGVGDMDGGVKAVQSSLAQDGGSSGQSSQTVRPGKEEEEDAFGTEEDVDEEEEEEEFDEEEEEESEEEGPHRGGASVPSAQAAALSGALRSLR